MLIWLISGIAGNLMAMNLSPLSGTHQQLGGF